MAVTPKIEIGKLTERQATAEATVNLGWERLEQIAAHGPIVDRDLTAPPGSPAAGDAYIPKATATGDWASHEDEIAYYNDGWYFVMPTNGMQILVTDEKIWLGYSAGAWHPMQTPHSTTETWTGRYDRNASKIYSKTIDLGALPNSTSATTAHGVTGIDLAKRILFEGWAEDGGTNVYPLPYANAGGTARMALKIDATNITIVTNFNASSFTGEVRIEYCKT
jgi:hypothetical protein